MERMKRLARGKLSQREIEILIEYSTPLRHKAGWMTPTTAGRVLLSDQSAYFSTDLLIQLSWKGLRCSGHGATSLKTCRVPSGLN